MKAVVVSSFGGPDVLKFQERHAPVPQANQVVIETAAASVNFADIMARQGRYHGGGQPPFVPGLDVAGTIKSVGREVRHLGVGQRVIAFPLTGSYAEQVVADAVLTYPIPDSIDFETAAAFPTVGVTVYNLLVTMANLQRGESVLIHAAAGGIGTTAVQLAKRLGAGTIIGTVGSAEKARLVKELGVDHVINYREENFADKVKQLTDGRGVDVILDSVAGEVFEQGLSCLARFGRIVLFGHASGKPGRVETTQLHASSRSVLGYSMGTNRRYRPEVLRDSVEKVIELVATGQLRMVIGRRFALAEAAEAHRWVESRQSTGKVLLKVNA
jgi:NADPH2:quinone reductase